jgi:PT repeat
MLPVNTWSALCRCHHFSYLSLNGCISPLSLLVLHCCSNTSMLTYLTPAHSTPNAPTVQPSGRPTGQPSGQPTGQPTAQPTGQPTGQPTSNPSVAPTNQVYQRITINLFQVKLTFDKLLPSVGRILVRLCRSYYQVVRDRYLTLYHHGLISHAYSLLLTAAHQWHQLWDLYQQSC